MFAGREAELVKLNDLYNQKCFQCVIIYGRKRVGKTALISQFMNNKTGIHFTAMEVLNKTNLMEFSNAVNNYFKADKIMEEIESWNDIFDFIIQKIQSQQFVLVLDNFEYAAKGFPEFINILNKYIGEKFRDSKLFLILCSNNDSISNVDGSNNPIFEIEGFDYQDAFSMLDGFGIEEKIKIYASVGGTPFYLSQINKSETYENNMKRLYFNISGSLYNNPLIYLMKDIREPAMYNSIIAAIAAGASKLNEITAITGENRTKVSKYLSSLITLKIVDRECPFGEKLSTSRKSIYRLKDLSYYYWYRFVFPVKANIEKGNVEICFEDLSEYISSVVFPEICLQYMKRQNIRGNLPFVAEMFGRWWESGLKDNNESDNYVIAANQNKKSILIGGCKWDRQFDDIAEINKILDKKILSEKYNRIYYYFFSRKTFSEEAVKMAEKIDTLTLIRIKDNI